MADKLNITVNNNFPDPLDEYLVMGSSSTDSALAIELTRDDFSGMAFSNTSLPLTAPSLVAFTSVRFAFSMAPSIEAEGVLRTLQCTAGCVRTVPEPNSMLLFGAALGAFGLSRRRAAVQRRLPESGALSVRHGTPLMDTHPCPFTSPSLQPYAMANNRHRKVVASVKTANQCSGHSCNDCNTRSAS